jgi:hypothetical protein
MVVGHTNREDGWYRSARSYCQCEKHTDVNRLAGYAAKVSFTDTQWKSFRERAFSCPTAYTTKSREKYGIPTWRYIYFGD